MRHQDTSGPGPLRQAGRWARAGRPRWRTGFLASAAVIAAALSVAACGSSSPSSSGPPSTSPAAGSVSSGSALKTTAIGGITVLTNARGFTLYMFAPDTGTTSKCTGSCAQVWPPVTGPATAGPGVTGTLGTLTRAGGATQASYDGHPLYTYAGDTQPGQAKGNGLNGVWHEVTASGTAPAAASPAAGGNGY